MAFVHMMQPSFLFLFLALPILFLFMFANNRRLPKKKVSLEEELPPGPAQLPVVGNLHLLAGGKSLHRALWELSKQHGPLMHLKIGRVPVLVVSSAATAKEVLKEHDVDCFNRPLSIPAQTITYGNSDLGFAPYDERLKERRRICKEEFFNSNKVASFTSVIEDEIGRTMKSIASRAKDSLAVDVSHLSSILFNNIICKVAFGRSCDEGQDMRIHAILEAQAMLSGFFLGDYLPQLRWVDAFTGMRGRLRRTFLELDHFFQQLFKEHSELSHGGNILDALLHVQKDTKNMTEDEIKGIIVDIFIAGTDTSSSMVEWAMTELMRHPEVMKRAQDELRGRVGRKGRVEGSDLRQLHYLKAVMKETMRLHPPSPLLLPRESVRGFKLRGYDVAQKTTIFVNAFAIGRDPSSWQRPEEFLPERFMDQCSNTDLRNHHDFKLLPFGEGRRMCPGMNLGLLMTELALANLLYCFDWSLPAEMAAAPENIDMGETTGLTVHRRIALCLVATEYGALEV